MTLNILDLFSGIGGFSLGLERTNHFKTIGFCEIDPFAQQVLKKHWPNVPIYNDIQLLKGADCNEPVDIITGGFPCQDLSFAGNQAGLAGKRSGLWAEMFRLISEIQPKYALIENVTALLAGESGAWFNRLLADLASIRYDAEWHCIRARAIGLPHSRDRIWIIAYPTKKRWNDNGMLLNKKYVEDFWQTPEQMVGDPSWESLLSKGSLPEHRNDNGLSQAVHRIGALGNSIVPQIAEMIGHAIAKDYLEGKVG